MGQKRSKTWHAGRGGFDGRKLAVLEPIAVVAATDYYSVKIIDAHQAFYVIGSNVLGPMEHQLVSNMTLKDAQDFMKGHKGKRILIFEGVSAGVIKSLDKGRPQ